MSEEIIQEGVAVPATMGQVFIYADEAKASAHKALLKGIDTFYTGQSPVKKVGKIGGGQNASNS